MFQAKSRRGVTAGGHGGLRATGGERAARRCAVAAVLLASAAVAWAAAGDLDATFGAGGVVSAAPAISGATVGTPFGMAVQTIGTTERCLVTGFVDNDADGYADDWYVAAYTPSGSLDTSFGPTHTGVVRVLGTSTDPYVRSSRVGMTVDPQGRILRVGTSAIVTKLVGKGGTSQTSTTPALTVARLTPDGQLDTTFNKTGVVRVEVSDRYVNGVVVLSSGRIVVVGTNLTGTRKDPWERIVMVGLTSNGALDSGFGSGGVVYDTARSTTVYVGVGVQSGDRLVVASRPTSAGTDNANQWLTTRFTSSGALDTKFGSSGRTLSSGMAIGALAIEPGTDAILPYGTLFRGYGSDAVYNHLAIGRMTADGAFDSSFGHGGLADVAYAGANLYSGYTVEALGGGNVAVGFQVAFATGARWSTIARLTSTGDLDATYGSGGLGTYVSGSAYCTARSSAGLLLAGQAIGGPFFLARFQN